jgi:hypothetical protein
VVTVIVALIAIGVAIVYVAGYSAGRQSIRDKFNKLMHPKGRK